MKLRDTHALVTGASRGIGVEIAREFTRRGARVTVLGRDEERLAAVAEEVGGKSVRLNLGEPADLDGAIERIEADAGPIDVLVNNAGVAWVNGVEEVKPGDAHRLLAVNTIAPIELCGQLLPRMLQRGRGHVVNLSSLAGVSAVPDLAIYGASKAALHHYTTTAQRELARTPVRMTLVTLAEVAGTYMTEEATKSPSIAAVSKRLAKVLPTLTPPIVARGVADAVEQDKRSLTLPRRLSPTLAIRDLPSTMQDLAFLGLPA